MKSTYLLIAILSAFVIPHTWSQVALPNQLKAERTKEEIYGKNAEGHKIAVQGKAKKVAKSVSAYLGDSYRVSVKRKGKKGYTELFTPSGAEKAVQIRFEVEGQSGGLSFVKWTAWDDKENPVEMSSSFSSDMNTNLKKFAKQYYRSLFEEELKTAQKKSAKENKSLDKTVKNRDKAEKNIAKMEKKISKADSKILKYQKKMNNLKQHISDEQESIEDFGKKKSQLESESQALGAEIDEQTKNLEKIQKKEREIRSKIEMLEKM